MKIIKIADILPNREFYRNQKVRFTIYSIHYMCMCALAQCLCIRTMEYSNSTPTCHEPPHDKTKKKKKWPLHSAKTQISLGIHPVWSKSMLCAQRVAKEPSFLHTDSEDSDQTGQMPRLIWIFAGCTCHFTVLSCGGSFVFSWVCTKSCLLFMSSSSWLKDHSIFSQI